MAHTGTGHLGERVWRMMTCNQLNCKRGAMGFFDRLFSEVHVPGADGVRILDVPSAMNLRELGGYDTPYGPTASHRFLRCGSTRCLGQKDRRWLSEYGLTHVLDLRGSGESPELTCPYARDRGVTWANIPFFGFNLSDPALVSAKGNLDYLAGAYLSMLGNHDAVCQVMTFLAKVPREECALFHCAAGMDRTGVTAMLLLGSVGVSRTDIVRDYLYSFAPVQEVDRFVETGETPPALANSRLSGRLKTIASVYDVLVDAYGSITDYLLACGMDEATFEALQQRMVG